MLLSGTGRSASARGHQLPGGAEEIRVLRVTGKQESFVDSRKVSITLSGCLFILEACEALMFALEETARRDQVFASLCHCAVCFAAAQILCKHV